MPRPYPPPLLPPPRVPQFPIGETERRNIAQTLDLKNLPREIEHDISTAISAYKATSNGSRDTTVGNTIAALREIENPKRQRTYKKAVARLADDRSGVDYTTHNLLQPLARAALEHQPCTQKALATAAQKRIGELCQHARANPPTESLRFFCGRLRTIFNAATPHLKGKITVDEAWQRCRKFALEVFTVAGIEHANFVAHPERLTEYLGTDVSTD